MTREEFRSLWEKADKETQLAALKLIWAENPDPELLEMFPELKEAAEETTETPAKKGK